MSWLRVFHRASLLAMFLACLSLVLFLPLALALPGQPQTLVTEFRISSRWNLADPTDHIREGARRVCQHFRSRPHYVLEMEPEGRRLLLGTLALQQSFPFLVTSWASLIVLQAVNPFWLVSRNMSPPLWCRQSSGAICERPASINRRWRGHACKRSWTSGTACSSNFRPRPGQRWWTHRCHRRAGHHSRACAGEIACLLGHNTCW